MSDEAVPAGAALAPAGAVSPLARGVPVAAVATCALGILALFTVGDLVSALMLLMLGGAAGLGGAVLNLRAYRAGRRGARAGLLLSLAAILAFPVMLGVVYLIVSLGGFT